MIKILSQDGKTLYDLGNNNIFVCGQKILISNEINIYQGKAALLGFYNDEEEAQNVLYDILERLMFIYQTGNFNCIRMPKAGEEEKGEEKDGGEQGEVRENDKI